MGVWFVLLGLVVLWLFRFRLFGLVKVVACCLILWFVLCVVFGWQVFVFCCRVCCVGFVWQCFVVV